MDGQLNLGYWFTLLEPLVSHGDACAHPRAKIFHQQEIQAEQEMTDVIKVAGCLG